MGMLDGRTAIITGAGQGIGQGIAYALAKEGAAVAVAGRTEAKLQVTCDAIAGFGGKALPIVADVTSAADIDRIVCATVAGFGGIDILINNAQIAPLGTLLDIAESAFVDGFSSGPLAVFRLMRAVHPYMKARGGGSIVNFASSAGKRWDMSGYGAYGAVKQAIRVLTRAAAAEWGVDGIRVNTLAPHALSPGLKMWIESRPEEAKAFFRTIPLRRIGDCENDIGRFVVMLVSADAGYLTGATIPLDGGQANFD
jgi:meso-butanediol dehydrogenase / (S,S)-butanediol dehydrogenase / diacetyl reductase